MTLNKFLEALSDSVAHVTWEFDSSGSIRTVEDEDCPIHAVWQLTEEGREEGMLEDWGAEADRLGLRSGVAKKIVDATDGRGKGLPLRRRLLAACGIEEKK